MADSLETELKTYEEQKHNLLADEGKYVVIHGKDVLGVYATYEDALKVGYEKCKLEPFLVKKIQAVEPVNFVSRDIPLECPTSRSK
jgi:ABC-type tungstate transport system permease subunit